MESWVPDLKVAVPAPGMHADVEHGSNDSSSTEMDVSGMTGDAGDQRTHHLLKHCLSMNQRDAALQHFSTCEVKEAAKDISRMGQRELQAKFKVRGVGGCGRLRAQRCIGGVVCAMGVSGGPSRAVLRCVDVADPVVGAL